MPHAFIAGVDLGASNVRVAIANEDGEIEARRASPFDGSEPERALNGIGRTIDDLVRGVWPTGKVHAVGIAMPGTVHPDRGLVASAANMPGWGEVDLAKLLGGPRGVPVAAENDANAAAVGEGWLGAAKGMRDYVFVALGTGIGTGIVLDGRLHRGAHYLAGEAAFFPMTRDQLHAADWQHNLESIVGGRAIATQAVESLGAHAKPGDLFEAAQSGDARAKAWLEEWQDYLAMAIVDIIALLDPQTVIVGGGVAAAQGEAMLAPVRERAHASLPVKTPVVLSQLAADAQILGAVKLALDLLQPSK
jgi:glucokinase